MNILNSDGNFSEFSIDRPCHTGDVASKFRKIKVFEVTVCLPILLQLRGWLDTGCVETQWQRWPNAKNMQNWIMKCRLPGKHSVTVRLSDFITICEERSGPDWEGRGKATPSSPPKVEEQERIFQITTTHLLWPTKVKKLVKSFITNFHRFLKPWLVRC